VETCSEEERKLFLNEIDKIVKNFGDSQLLHKMSRYNYFIKDNRLWLIKRRIEVVPEAERKHPVLGMFRSIEEETVDLCYHGWFEMYGPYTTWKLKFTDGELMQSIFVPHDTDTAPVSGSTAEDCQDDTEEIVAHWKGDGYVPEPDYDDYEG
jgi:hypothetical protein